MKSRGRSWLKKKAKREIPLDETERKLEEEAESAGRSNKGEDPDVNRPVIPEGA